MNISQHAYKVVEGFKKSLTKEQRKTLGNENFEELQILVEAALGDTATKALHDVAKKMEKLANKTRKQAANINELEE